MSLGTNITCITDPSDTSEKGKMWLELTFSNPGCVTYDYTMSGYKTVHLYCIYDDNWYYDKQTVYVGEEITAVKVGDANDNTFIPMTSSADIFVSYENGSDVTLEIESNTTGVSLLRENMTSTNHTFTITASDFGNSYGQFALRFSLSNILNTVEKWVVILYEEEISGFTFTGATVPIVHVGDNIPLSFTLTSGTDVVITIDIGTISLIEKCDGELRSHSLPYTANETGTYPVTITLSNFVSMFNHSFDITVQYPVNNITITRTEVMMVGDSNPMTFVMDAIAMIPMGAINAKLSILENYTQTSQTQDYDLTTLNPGGNQPENVDSYYTAPGYYLVHAMIYSEIHNINYTWLKIVEHELDLDIVAMLSVPLSKAEQEIGVTIVDPAKSPLYKLNCSFDIDGDVVNHTFDSVAHGSNATITYFYPGDGNKTLTVTCQNNLRTWQSSVYVDVYTDCFESTQLFDSVYKTANTPLKVYVTDVTQITGKVVVSDKCKNSSRTYWWDFYDVDRTDKTTLTLMGYYNNSQNQPAGITITFAEEAIEPGLKKLSLTANLTEAEGAVLIDHIFVYFQVPTIFAAIKGGSQRLISNQAALEVDAESLSKEPYNKVKNIPFGFSWSCRTIIHSTINENDISVGIARLKSTNPDLSFQTSYGADCTGLIQNPSSGKITLNQGDLTPDYWYIFFVNVSKTITTTSTPPLTISRDDNAVQAVRVVSYEPPNVGIRCLRNCREKVTRDTLVTVDVTCDSCQAGSTLYQWEITKFIPAPVNDFQSLPTVTESQVIVTETVGIQNQDKTGTKANKQKAPPYEKKRTPDMGMRPGAQEE
ncbi:hypothetical protein FSP39_008408 [Pinctada imbricata]|uniref:PKD/REJ-like domain-containing protein n=1 Tax=Pinctada imbricata TaxID=66713 RepID=A0AA88XQP1_PINIB|nr:hypothetical protein FSP39_008408 [Pinctada imbricata]